ncbi:ATP-binding protein [Streptomyces malaysiensis subsp. malaysiensis]|uniref:ATP-binding protein n=1 Tax=Streptomyces malaysiensis TaxID=92644 RepID=UPI000BFD7A96|nr:ATP-binding protein [Streptomyces malaysiensis]QDL71655.1 ATP-binding protein [Streptomyces malaysiensis]
MMTSWQFEVPTTGSKHLPPDARYMEALSSQGYGFEVAIADLVDNSIDAGAKDVLIHFLRDGEQLVSLLVVDDGRGMDEEALDVAMTIGGRQSYDLKSLGMFGTGLKSASLSHADAVTVVSTTKRTRTAGRRWLMEHAKAGFQCDIVESDFAQTLIDRYYDKPITWQGTIVRWDGVKDFPKHGGSSQTDRYLHRTINKLGLHLGLYLHRFLARADFNITIAVEDVLTGTVYLDFGVEPLDPFAYPVTGSADYPRQFHAPIRSLASDIVLNAHVWPPKSNTDEYRAVGSVIDRQGFYFYRNDRLVQAGGWNNYRQPEQHLSLARVAIDLPPNLSDVFRLTVKKSGVDTSPEFTAALDEATDTSGIKFSQFLSDADSVYREARRRVGVTRKAVIGPGEGIAPEVRAAIEEELPLLPNEDSITICWKKLSNEIFFHIDREQRTIALNQYYRRAILGGRDGSPDDAPLLKSLMYLLLREVFEKEYSGRREKDNLQLWQSILVAAARSELDRVTDDDS